MATMMSVAGSAVVAAPATSLSSSATLGSGVQQLGVVRSPAASFHGSRMVAVRASQSSNEERSPKALVALVAAGAALALTVAPMSPAQAGLFSNDNIKVERGATAPDFPGNEGTGNKVGSNTDVRGAGNTGTPLGEGAGGALMGENQSTRQASATGTPLGEGAMNTGSGVNLSLPSVGDLPSVPSLPNPSNVVGDLKDKLPGGVPDAGSVASDVKSKIGGGLPDAGSVASDVKSKIGGGLPDAGSVASDVKSKLPGGVPDAGSAASDAKDMAKNKMNMMGGNMPDAGDAKNAASNLVGSAKGVASDVAKSDGPADTANKVESAKSSIMGLPNPFDAGKSLMNKVTGN